MKTRDETRSSGRVSIYCSACGTRHDVPYVVSRNESYLQFVIPVQNIVSCTCRKYPLEPLSLSFKSVPSLITSYCQVENYSSGNCESFGTELLISIIESLVKMPSELADNQFSSGDTNILALTFSNCFEEDKNALATSS